MERKIKVLSVFTMVVGVLLFLQTAIVLAAATPTFSQLINAGTQSVDIVDAGGTTVGSPGVTFGAVTFSFDYQTATGTLGTTTAKIRVYNPTADATWAISIAATSGATAIWSDGGTNTYDYNDTGTDGTDDADADAKGGRLTVDPSVATVTGVPNDGACSPTTGMTKGSSASFKEVAVAVSSITLLTGGASAATSCRWDMKDIGLSQVIPGSQAPATYTLGFTITIA